MVSRDDYLMYCQNAFIDVLPSEHKLLDGLTNRMGMFDPDRYILVCENAKVFITKNQRDILKNLPAQEDDEIVALGKQSHLRSMVLKISRRNLSGI